MKFGEWNVVLSKKLGFIRTIVVLIFVFLIAISLVNNFMDYDIVYSGDEKISVIFDGVCLEFDQDPIIIDSRTLVPMRKIFEELESKVTWYEETDFITSSRYDLNVTMQIGSKQMIVNDKFITLDVEPMLIGERTMIPARAVSEVFGCFVDWDEKNRIVIIKTPYIDNNVLDGTVITDDYRYTELSGIYNGVSVFYDGYEDYFGMELMKISGTIAEKYANIVNGIAEKIPEVRVFSAFVPTPAEFYAPKSYTTNFLSGLSKIYSRLSDNIIPVNVERVLMENADKSIYFKTDHHWTHLGSYYAYREFCEMSGTEPAELDSFDSRIVKNFVGSWETATYDTEGYNMINDSDDSLEVFLPIVDYEAMSYEDMYLNSPIKNMSLFNFKYKNYSIFIEGDYPLEVYKTSTQNGKSICVIKDSYGNAFSTWLINNYEYLFVVDYRIFNDNNANSNRFDIRKFYDIHKFDDLLIINYPYTAISNDLRRMLGQTLEYNYYDF